MFDVDKILPESYLSAFYDIIHSLREVQKVLFERVSNTKK